MVLAVGVEEGLPDLCPLEIGARDDGSGSPCRCRLRLRRRVPGPARGGRKPLITDAELVALSVAQAAIGISSDRQFLGLIGRVLPGWFPHLPDQSQYNRRLRGLVE